MEMRFSEFAFRARQTRQMKMTRHTAQFGCSKPQDTWSFGVALSANCLVIAKRSGLYENARKDWRRSIV